MSINFYVYMYPETTGWIDGIEQITLHYEAGVHGFEDISPITHDISIDPENVDHGSGVFETLEIALQYYLVTAGPTITSAVNLATGGDYEFYSELRFNPQDAATLEYRLAAISAVEELVVLNYDLQHNTNTNIYATFTQQALNSTSYLGDTKTSLITADHDYWMLCDNREVSIETYYQAYLAVGNQFNGESTTEGYFRLPHQPALDPGKSEFIFMGPAS